MLGFKRLKDEMKNKEQRQPGQTQSNKNALQNGSAAKNQKRLIYLSQTPRFTIPYKKHWRFTTEPSYLLPVDHCSLYLSHPTPTPQNNNQ